MLVSLSDVERAAELIRGVADETPLLRAPAPAGGPGDGEPGVHGSALWLKCESFQPIGAFKLRGGYNFTAHLAPEERALGVITYSSGNHAQAVAYAARAFDIPATVVMPTDVPAVKLEGTRRLGANVELCGTLSSERESRAREIAGETGSTIVPPFDDPRIIAGQGTAGLELLRQLDAAGPRGSDAPLIVVPVGGGGLISGVATAVRALRPKARIVGVEPVGAASMSAALRAGKPVAIENVDTIADGLKPVRVGDLTYAHCAALVDDVVTVTDQEIAEGVRWCFARHLVVEPSGAAAVAAVLGGQVHLEPDRPTVLVVTGGNVDRDRLCALLGTEAVD